MSSPSVTLVVKAPDQKIADQKVECTVDWTVQKLKQHLSRVYPTNPAQNLQRIIYSGKLLQDGSRLMDVLRQYEPDQTVHTIHLVCTSPASDSRVQSSKSEQNAAAGDIYADGLRRRLPGGTRPTASAPEATPQSTIPNANYGSYVPNPGFTYYGGSGLPLVPPVATGFVPYGIEQLAWMQQAYMQSMMHYFQQFHQPAVYPQQVVHASPVVPQPTNQSIPNEPPAAAANEAEPPVQPGWLNAQGGRDVEDDGAERANADWLDSSFMIARFLMLMSILYFYSTPTRFLAMMILAAIAYLYHCAWVRRRRTENRNQELRETPPEQVPAENQGQQMPQDPEMESAMVNLQSTHRPSTFEVIWSVISSFFTSLFPENPPPINVN